jgi:hypothetical protein
MTIANEGEMMRKLVGLLVALTSMPVAAGSMPHVELTVQYRPGTDAPNRVRLKATNFGPGNAYVMSYQTAFALPEGRTTGKWLLVRDEAGIEVPYKGRWVLTRAPGPSSYRSIAPGETITSDIDLATEYALPDAGSISVTSAIDIMSRIPSLDAMGEPEDVPHELVESAAVQFSVRTAATPRQVGTSSIMQCSTEQTAATQQAIISAQAASHEALMFLSSLYYSDPIDPENPTVPRVHMKPHLRYQYWFGQFDEWAPQPPEPGWADTDNAMVDQVVAATYARLLGGAQAVCDSCPGYDPSSRAWNEGDLIHLCPVNFLDPVNGGVTSQAGTIAHEVSHRPDGYAIPTQDFPNVRNRATAHALDRTSAVRSGANYEYFIMNVPLGRAAKD